MTDTGGRSAGPERHCPAGTAPRAGYDAHTALVVVDLQNDFADPAGSLYVAGAEEVVAAVNGQIAAARASGALVVYTQDWHPPDTPHFAKDGGIWPVHCVAGSWGAQLVPGLLVVDGPIIRTGVGGEDGYSGFTVRDPLSGAQSPTDLAAILEREGVRHLVVAGLATDYCVKETVLDGLRLGYSVTVSTSGVRPVDLHPGDGERALEAMARAGAHLRP